MAYCTIDDIKKHLNETELVSLTDDARTGLVNSAVVTEAIAAADNLIDGYARSRYDVPFSPVPPLINNISTKLAVCELLSRNPALTIAGQAADLRKEQTDLLEKIRTGEIILPVEPPAAEPSNIRCNKTAEDRMFTDDLLSKM